jgi:hypothetical protein
MDGRMEDRKWANALDGFYDGANQIGTKRRFMLGIWLIWERMHFSVI